MPSGTHPDERIQRIRSVAETDFTFTVSMPPEDVLKHINADRKDEYEVDGEVVGVTGGRVVVQTDEQFRVFGDELWLSRFGGNHVELVEDTGSEIRCRMYDRLRLNRWVIDKIKKRKDFEEYLQCLEQSDGSGDVYIAYFLDNMIDTYEQTPKVE